MIYYYFFVNKTKFVTFYYFVFHNILSYLLFFYYNNNYNITNQIYVIKCYGIDNIRKAIYGIIITKSSKTIQFTYMFYFYSHILYCQSPKASATYLTLFIFIFNTKQTKLQLVSGSNLCYYRLIIITICRIQSTEVSNCLPSHFI